MYTYIYIYIYWTVHPRQRLSLRDFAAMPCFHGYVHPRFAMLGPGPVLPKWRHLLTSYSIASVICLYLLMNPWREKADTDTYYQVEGRRLQDIRWRACSVQVGIRHGFHTCRQLQLEEENTFNLRLLAFMLNNIYYILDLNVL